jgi:hypothetical protein
LKYLLLTPHPDFCFLLHLIMVFAAAKGTKLTAVDGTQFVTFSKTGAWGQALYAGACDGDGNHFIYEISGNVS